MPTSERKPWARSRSVLKTPRKFAARAEPQGDRRDGERRAEEHDLYDRSVFHRPNKRKHHHTRYNIQDLEQDPEQYRP
jgi:hypothetical protein